MKNQLEKKVLSSPQKKGMYIYYEKPLLFFLKLPLHITIY